MIRSGQTASAPPDSRIACSRAPTPTPPPHPPPSNRCNLEQHVLRERLSGRLKGEPTRARSSAFIDPGRNLCVSGGGLRLGSLLSAFISVSFAVPPSCSQPFSPRLYLPLLSPTPPPPPPTPPPAPHPSLLHFYPKELEKKMSPDQISGSPQPRLSASVCLLQRVIASVMFASTSLVCANLTLPRYRAL